ncbi:MAG: type II toxin-antitoxin system HicB family antitoxin [Deltaproteobacteria bacterium]|nr:type II toxin-antitoxin system HicB family antitoxin [Deltaproteobacteria bacterium]
MTHKGYSAKVEYSEKDQCLVGCVSDIRESITFQGESVTEIRLAFEKAVDAYLDRCAAKNEEPEKPSSGRSVVRMTPALHSILALAAGQEKKSVNEWLADIVKKPKRKND